jgi:starch synthase
MEGLRELAGSLPKKVSLAAAHDETMSHLITAGSDFFLMPSRFEPCGLNQMYAQLYGTIPIVSGVGGLADTVVDLDADPRQGTGIQVPVTPEGLLSGLNRALALHRQVKRLVEVQLRGMRRDFSWSSAVRGYEALYADET